MRCKKILAAAVSVVMAAGQFSVGAFAENPSESSSAALSADGDTTGEQDGTTSNDESKSYDIGDVNGNGKIDINDVVKTAAHIKARKLLSEKGMKAADINADGKINITDLTLLAAHIKGKKNISAYTDLPVVKNPREKQTNFKLIEFNVDKNTKTVSWNAAADMTNYNVQFTNGDKTKEINTRSTGTNIPYDMFKDGKLTVTITPSRLVWTEDGERTYDHGDTTGYLLKIKPEMIHGTITVTDEKGKAKIDWQAADFASGYHVYDITNTASDGKPKLIADTDTDQLITDFPAGGTVKLLIVPFNSVGEAEGVNAELTSGTVTEPDPVADLAAPTFGGYYYVSDTKSATLSWNGVSGAEGYEASIQINGKWVAYTTTAKSYKFTNLASCTGFKTRVRAYKTVNGQKAYGKYSTTVTVVTDGYVKCTTATPIYASASTSSAKLGNLYVGDTIMQTDLPANGWTKVFLPNSNGTQTGYVPTNCLNGTSTTDPVADLAAPTFNGYFYNSDTTTATLMWNGVSGAEGYEASIQINGKWVAYNTTAKSYKFTSLASCTGFKTRVRAYKTVNGQKAYGKYSTTVTVITDGYVKCTTATPIYASASTSSAKLGNLYVGDTIMQTDLPANGWTKVFLPNSNGTQIGYVPTNCLNGTSTTDRVADLAAPTFNGYFYNSDTTTATLMWNGVSGAEGYEASIQINGKWVSYTTTAKSYKFTDLASCTGFKTRVRAYKTVNGQKAYGKYSTTVTVVTDGYVKCTTATPIYASASTSSTKLGNLYVGDTIMQTDLPANGWTKVFLPKSNGTQIGYVPTNCLNGTSTTDPVADLAAPTFNGYFYNSDTTTATLIWNGVSGAEGYEASIQINGKWVAYNTTAKSYKFTDLASCTGFKTRVRAYKTVNGQKAYGKYSTTVTVVTDGYVKCTTATPIYASASTSSAKLGNLYAGDTIMQTDLPANGWTKVFLPNSNGTQIGYVPTNCLNGTSTTDPVADLAAPTFNGYFYNSDTTTATLMWNGVSGAEGYEASIQINGKWVAYTTTAKSYKFTDLASCTGFKTRVRAYKTVNGQKAYGKYSTTVTVVTDGYVKCTTATPIYASESTSSTKLGNLYAGDTIMQTDLPVNGWTKVFLPNSNGTQIGYVPTNCLNGSANSKSYVNHDLSVINQDGYLGGNPAVLGCEETALASVLNYQFGINVSKNTLIDYYMPEQAFSNGTINVDPNYCFWGSPYHMEGSVGYGCYAPLIAQSANQYLKALGVRDNYNIALNTDYYTGNNVNKLKFDPTNLDLGDTKVSGGLDLNGLKKELDKGNNPIIWYSEIEPYAVCTQTLTAGQKYTNPGSGTYNFTWYGRQHTVVLMGYDDTNKCFIIGNVENFDRTSFYGKTQTISYDEFMNSYNTLGRQTVVISKK